MSLFAPQKMSLNESKNWASKSRRLKDSCLANTLVLGAKTPAKCVFLLSHIRCEKVIVGARYAPRTRCDTSGAIST